MDKLLRLSFRGGKSSSTGEPELDFRPSARKPSVPSEGLSSDDKLAQAELNRWSQGGGGAVVGNVEWVPDPVTGGQRALFRPVSAKILENAVKKDAHQQSGSSEEATASHEKAENGASHGDNEKARRTGRAGRADPMANMTPEEKSAHAKRVIEEAIEAERQALEKKLAIKKKGRGDQ